jgi:hypothetical protein
VCYVFGLNADPLSRYIPSTRLWIDVDTSRFSISDLLYQNKRPSVVQCIIRESLYSKILTKKKNEGIRWTHFFDTYLGSKGYDCHLNQYPYSCVVRYPDPKVTDEKNSVNLRTNVWLISFEDLDFLVGIRLICILLGREYESLLIACYHGDLHLPSNYDEVMRRLQTILTMIYFT